jgi:hypothetical protein
MEEEQKDLKVGEEETPPGNDPPEEKTTKPEESASKVPDGMVQISEAELQKLKEEKENYRKGMLSVKRKGRTLPGVEPEKKPKVDDYGDPVTEPEFITKKEFIAKEQKLAISEACKDSETDEYYDDIIFYYRPEHGQDDRDNILLDIQKAKKLWRADNPIVDNTAKKVTVELANDKGLGSGKKKDATPVPERKHIIPKHEKMETWFDKK